MRIKIALSYIVMAAMLISTLPAYATVATEPLYEDEYFVQGDFEGTSQIPGQRDGFGWGPYYSPTTAVRSIVTRSVDGDEAVYEGDAAIKFANTATDSGRGIYYDPRNMERKFKEGETVELSGWFRTDAPGGASIWFTVGNSPFSNYNITTSNIGSEWTYISGRYTFTEEAKNTTSGIQANFRINTDVSANDDAKPDKSGYIYADNLSLRTVKEIWASDATLELTANMSNALARVDYTYMGTTGNEEGETVVELQTNNANTENGWTTYKTISSVNENNVKESIVALDSGCVEKYLRVMVQPVSSGGVLGSAVYTDPVFVSKSTNIARNPELKWMAYGWTGGEYQAADEALKISSEAVYDSELAVTADTGFNISFDAKGSGDISVYINDSDTPVKTQTLTEETSTIDISATVGVCASMKLRIEGNDAVIDNLSIRPQLPEVYGVAIGGKAVGGATVKAEYTYDSTNDDGKAEGATRIEWYLDGVLVSTDTNFAIPQGTEGVLTLKVTPVDADGVEGNAVEATADVYSVYVTDMRITADMYTTNGILVPRYSYHGTASEGDSKLEWVAADSPDAPADVWESFDVYNSAEGRRGIPAAKVTAANVSENGWLPLSQEQRGKYIAFRITPKDSNGREGLPTVSEATPLIEFERNLINNGNVSNGTKNFKMSSGSYSSENSSIPTTDDGSGSIFVDGTNRKTAMDTHGKPTAGGGNDIFDYYPSFMPKKNVKYTLTADIRMKYDTAVSQNYTLMFITSAGYTANSGKMTNEWGDISVSITPSADANGHNYFTLRALGDADNAAVVKAGQLLIDNIRCYDSLPWASDLSLTGSPEVGETLKAQYCFNNASVAKEWNSEERWLVSDYKWGPWTEYKSGEGTSEDIHTLTVTSDLEGKYIRFEVTPQDMTGTKGLSMQTTNEVFVAPTDQTNVTVSQNESGAYTADADFTNSQVAKRTIWAILTGVKTVNGRETICDVSIDKKEVAAGETATFSMTLTDNTSDSAKVIFAEGASFDKLRPISGDMGGGANSSVSEKNKAALDQDSKTVSVSLSSENPNQTALVWALNDGYIAADVTDANYNAAIGYIGLAKTGAESGGKIDFGMDALSNGNEIDVRATFRDGTTHDYTLPYDADAAAKIVDALKNADNSAVDGYLSGNLIDGTIDMAALLGIDLTDYNRLENNIPVTSLLAGVDFTGRTSDIRTIIETESKKLYDYEVWTAKMSAFTTAIQNTQPSGLREIMNTYNDVLDLNLMGEYGFAIQLGKDADTAFCSELLAALKARIGETHEETLANIRADFDKLVAIAAVNCGPWNKMQQILAAHWSLIGLGSYEKYNDSSYDKTAMYQNIYNQSFTGTNANETLLKIKNFVEQQIEALTKSVISGPENNGITGSVGGGIGGGATKNPISDTTGAGWNFSDIDNTHWAYGAINICAEKGIIRGYNDNSYRPDVNVTRAEFVTILLRSAGIKTDVTFEEKFGDVKKGDWYAAAIYKAYALGIVNGVDESSFAPDSEITREEMSAMVYRLYSDKLKKNDGISFTDADSFADWSKTAIDALASSGIILGMDNGAFEPKAMLTRAMAAQIAARLISM